MTNIYWYRVEDYLEGHGYVDECGEYVHTGSTVRVRIVPWRVVKETKCGVRLECGFVNRSWTKRFAAPTKEEAVKDFIARKKRQIGIYEGRLSDARQALEIVKNGKIPEGPLGLFGRATVEHFK